MTKKITSEIKFLVELDENRVPEKLMWTAQDGGVEAEEAKKRGLEFFKCSTNEEMLQIMGLVETV